MSQNLSIRVPEAGPPLATKILNIWVITIVVLPPEAPKFTYKWILLFPYVCKKVYHPLRWDIWVPTPTP